MNIWALRRRQIMHRYGKWTFIFTCLGLLGSFIYNPDASGWAAVGDGLSRVGSSIGRAAGMVLPTTAQVKSAVGIGNFAVKGREQRVAGFLESEVRCLALALHYDGADDPIEVKKAIAQVAINRVNAKKSKALCRVVYAGFGLPHGCLFKSTCRRIGAPIPEGPAWDKSLALANEVVAAKEHVAPKFKEATHFHAVTEPKPVWARGLFQVGLQGRFMFWSDLPVNDEADDHNTKPVAAAPARAAPARASVATSAPRPVAAQAPAARREGSDKPLSSVFER
jgi:hypothetical protein